MMFLLSIRLTPDDKLWMGCRCRPRTRPRTRSVWPCDSPTLFIDYENEDDEEDEKQSTILCTIFNLLRDLLTMKTKLKREPKSSLLFILSWSV